MADFKLVIPLPVSGIGNDYPGRYAAQAMREAADYIERPIPLVDGALRNRLTGEVRATWSVTGKPTE